MLASLKDDQLEELCGRGGGGIIACKLMPRRGSYDHKRTTMYCEEGRALNKGISCPLWDFVIFSSNGNVTGLRPRWGGTEFHVHYFMKDGIAVALPNEVAQEMLAPPGASVGPGTYKYYKQLERQGTWNALP